MKILDSLYNMHLKTKEYTPIVLGEDKTLKYKDKVWHFPKGTTILDCDDEEMAKVLYMNWLVDKAYRGGKITSEQIRTTVERAYNYKEITYEQTNLGFNR